MVGKGRVERGKLDLWHVAGDAVFSGDGTCGAGMNGCAFFGGGRDMTGEAIRIVGSRIVNERFVRIVAGNASDASVALRPTAAVLEAIRSEAHADHVSGIQLGSHDILPSAMAGAAKIDRIDAGQIRGIEDKAGAALLGFGVSGGDVLRSGIVA